MRAKQETWIEYVMQYAREQYPTTPSQRDFSRLGDQLQARAEAAAASEVASAAISNWFQQKGFGFSPGLDVALRNAQAAERAAAAAVTGALALQELEGAFSAASSEPSLPRPAPSSTLRARAHVHRSAPPSLHETTPPAHQERRESTLAAPTPALTTHAPSPTTITPCTPYQIRPYIPYSSHPIERENRPQRIGNAAEPIPSTFPSTLPPALIARGPELPFRGSQSPNLPGLPGVYTPYADPSLPLLSTGTYVPYASTAKKTPASESYLPSLPGRYIPYADRAIAPPPASVAPTASSHPPRRHVDLGLGNLRRVGIAIVIPGRNPRD